MSLFDLLASDLTAWMEAAPDGVPRRVLLWRGTPVPGAAHSQRQQDRPGPRPR